MCKKWFESCKSCLKWFIIKVNIFNNILTFKKKQITEGNSKTNFVMQYLIKKNNNKSSANNRCMINVSCFFKSSAPPIPVFCEKHQFVTTLINLPTY
jgi:hypothetical protein